MSAPIALTPEQQEFIQLLTEKLPPVIARKQVDKFLGGVIAPQTLSNADASGDGPEVAYRIGKSVVYSTEPLLKWLIQRYGMTRIAHAKLL